MELSNSKVKVVVPAGVLISIWRGMTISAVLASHDWFDSVMVRLSNLKAVDVLFPLQRKAQRAIMMHGCDVISRQLNALTVSKNRHGTSSSWQSAKSKRPWSSLEVIHITATYVPTPSVRST